MLKYQHYKSLRLGYMYGEQDYASCGHLDNVIGQAYIFRRRHFTALLWLVWELIIHNGLVIMWVHKQTIQHLTTATFPYSIEMSEAFIWKSLHFNRNPPSHWHYIKY